MLLETEGDGEGVPHSHHLTTLLGGCPVGHSAKDSEGFYVQRTIGFLWNIVSFSCCALCIDGDAI